MLVPAEQGAEVPEELRGGGGGSTGGSNGARGRRARRAACLGVLGRGTRAMAMRYWTSSSSSWRTCSARMLRILVRVTSTPQAVASAGRPLTARSRADRSLEPSSCSRSAIGSKSRSATVCAMVGGWTGGPHKGHHRRRFRRRARAEDAPRGPPDDARGTRRTRGARRRLRAKSARAAPTVPAVAVAVRTAAKGRGKDAGCSVARRICMAPSAYCAARRTDERPLEKPPFDHRRELPRCSRSPRGSGRCCGGTIESTRASEVADGVAQPTHGRRSTSRMGRAARAVRSWTRRRAAPAGEASGDAGCVEGQALVSQAASPQAHASRLATTAHRRAARGSPPYRGVARFAERTAPRVSAAARAVRRGAPRRLAVARLAADARRA